MQNPDITAGRIQNSRSGYENAQNALQMFQKGMDENNARVAATLQKWQDRDDALKAEERQKEAEWIKLQELYRQQVAEREAGQNYQTSEREATQDFTTSERIDKQEFDKAEKALDRSSQKEIAKGNNDATKQAAKLAADAKVFGIKAQQAKDTGTADLRASNPHMLLTAKNKNGKTYFVTDEYGSFVVKPEYREKFTASLKNAPSQPVQPNQNGSQGTGGGGQATADVSTQANVANTAPTNVTNVTPEQLPMNRL